MSQYVAGGDPEATVYMDELEQIAPDGGVIWSWNEFDHISLADLRGSASNTTGIQVDGSHTNAIEITDDGNYMLSLRNMSEIVKIDRVSGEVIWTLGGVASSFVFVNDPENGPSYQHGARELPNHHIILFDNGRYHDPWADRAVEYALDTDAGTATLVWQYQPDPALQALVFGFSERLDGGNTLITFGDTGRVQEVTKGGQVVWDLVDDQRSILPDGDLGPGPRDWGIYRSFRISTVY
jgi:hypothetical protein